MGQAVITLKEMQAEGKLTSAWLSEILKEKGVPSFLSKDYKFSSRLCSEQYAIIFSWENINESYEKITSGGVHV